ncbi:MAG: hypothetical protein ACD_47C00194G0002 [uncultured bacterium]|nr:MAG: hypothetical protein ACD_47C00194G0002 [uncultured bacterium]
MAELAFISFVKALTGEDDDSFEKPKRLNPFLSVISPTVEAGGPLIVMLVSTFDLII